ncbi:hypothetical protein BD779DRAFT_1443171, partial [Infundibulicybe gibba]
LGFRTLYPPVSQCLNNSCLNYRKDLLRRKMAKMRKIVLYTLADGACAAHTVKLHCYTCATSYSLNYSVHKGIRTYYGGVPNIIEVGKHQFVERDVLNLFVGMMLISWTSATNGSRIYDTCLSHSKNQPPSWPFNFQLRTEHVWDGFVILALLEDLDKQSEFLVVPHTGDQKDRFTLAMQKRNQAMAHSGQPEWAHWCNKCCRVWPGENGQPSQKVRVIVTDGITIGHPCCSVLHCSEPLSNNNNRFCPGHMAQESICAVDSCGSQVDPGFQTCSQTKHRELEIKYTGTDKGFFQLRDQLVRQKVSHPNDSFEATTNLANDEHVEELYLSSHESDPACLEKSQDSGGKIRARFGRKRTHNEQIMVRPCGIIVARQTFFGSETTPQTVDMLQKVFCTPGSMPEIVIYDLGCQLYMHLEKDNNPLLASVGFPVDVFHWKSKHKKSNVACAFHCNPTRFPELLDDIGGSSWFFNSSIAEQTNVWLGGYHAILREMGVDKFNFFLDEMIQRKNEMTKQRLEKDDVCVGYIPDLIFTTKAN